MAHVFSTFRQVIDHVLIKILKHVIYGDVTKMASSSRSLEQALLTFASAITQNIVASQAANQQSSSVPSATVVNNAPVFAVNNVNVSVNSPVLATNMASSNRYMIL